MLADYFGTWLHSKPLTPQIGCKLLQYIYSETNEITMIESKTGLPKNVDAMLAPLGLAAVMNTDESSENYKDIRSLLWIATYRPNFFFFGLYIVI